MTEDEAKTKWCPMVRAVIVDDEDYPRRIELMHAGRNEAGNHCIGSACMMWRAVVRQETTSGHNPAPAHWSRWRYVDDRDPLKVGEVVTEHGYCGLAGKP